MKRILTVAVLILMLAIPCFAQWSNSIVGSTIEHRSEVSIGDRWWLTSPKQVTASSLELAGYNSVRADYDVTGSGVSVSVNMQCSNDSLWVSGDSITITEDTTAVYDLTGCKDYNWFVENVSASDSITIYLTPFND